MARALDARALASRLLQQVTAAPGGDAALALPQGYFGAQHSCLFPSIVSVSLATGRSSARRPASRQHADRRALVTALALLSRSPRFDFCAFYDGFWRDAVLIPIAKLNPDARSYVSLNRCVTFVDELRFMLTLPRTTTARHFEQLLQFLRTPDSAVLSPEDRRVLLSERQHRPKNVTVTIILDVSSAVLKANSIKSIAEVLSAYAETPEEQLAHCAVRFQPVMLWFDQCHVSDFRVWDALAALFSSRSCQVSSLVLFYSRVKASRRHLQGFCQFVHRSVATPGLSSLRSLNFLGTHLKYQHVKAILSALWYENILEELCLEHFCDAGCKHMALWIWIALGVFHPDSKSRLRHLNLTHFHFSADNTRHRAKMLGLPNARSSVLLESSNRDREYEVSHMNERWVAVLAPGYGVVWVRSSAIVSERDIPSQVPAPIDATILPALPRRQIQSFTYRDIASRGCVMSVVQLLGDRLETLDLENSEITGEELSRILRLFPRLSTLNIRATADVGLEPLLHHCREVAQAGGRCALATLEVSVQSAGEVLQLARLLGEASGKSITRVHLYVKQSEAMQALSDVSRVLAHNRSLAYLGIFTRFYDGVWTLFRDYHGEMLRLALPLTRKLALLSAMRAPASEGKAIRSLDAGVLSIIFQFASTPVRREIHIFDEYE